MEAVLQELTMWELGEKPVIFLSEFYVQPEQGNYSAKPLHQSRVAVVDTVVGGEDNLCLRSWPSEITAG